MLPNLILAPSFALKPYHNTEWKNFTPRKVALLGQSPNGLFAFCGACKAFPPASCSKSALFYTQLLLFEIAPFECHGIRCSVLGAGIAGAFGAEISPWASEKLHQPRLGTKSDCHDERGFSYAHMPNCRIYPSSP